MKAEKVYYAEGKMYIESGEKRVPEKGDMFLYTGSIIDNRHVVDSPVWSWSNHGEQTYPILQEVVKRIDVVREFAQWLKGQMNIWGWAKISRTEIEEMEVHGGAPGR